MTHPFLRQEIAAAAARMIAEDGLDYSTAKRKAIKQLVGPGTLPRGDLLPDNDEIETEVREYQALYMGDTQPMRLARLRQVALSVMERLAIFRPYLVGPVWTAHGGGAFRYLSAVLCRLFQGSRDLPDQPWHPIRSG